MSLFRTHLPSPFGDFAKKLPEGARIISAKLSEDRKSIEIELEIESHLTPYSVPLDVPPGCFSGQTPFPELVKIRKVQNVAIAPEPATKVKKKK
ncbi:MAG: hypothetical protein KGJ13_06860 [Patescibacteria group bacterium]|nr:hypothetical protein [Patescibacteria group bacterium]